MMVENKALDLIAEYMKFREKPDYELVIELQKRDLLVRTEDGTFTLRSTDDSELMHSRIGALKEAFEKFAWPSQMAEIENPKLLDLCGGMGYNSLAALATKGNVKIHLLEYSKELLFLGSCLPLDLKEKALFNRAVDDFLHEQVNNQISIFCGDARSTVPTLPNGYYDVVFHDGFSPANDPVLYSVEFLSLLKRKLNSKGIILSYSSSIPFRRALVDAGFYIGEGPAVGRKRGITIGAVNSDDKRLVSRLPLHDEMLMALATVGTPFRDPELRATGEDISTRRELERAELRREGICLPVKKIKQNRIDPSYVKIAAEALDSRSAVLQLNNFLLTKKNK